MKKVLAFGLAAILFSMTSLANEAPEYKAWVGGFVEYYSADSDKPEPLGYLDDGTGFGAEFGFRFAPQWASRIEWSHLDLDGDVINGVGGDETGDRIGVDALYFLENDVAYLFGGAKYEKLDQDYRVANLGVGKHWRLHERWLVITEAAYYYDFGQGYNDFGLKLGLAYTFGDKSGSSRAASAAAVGDSDNDGVPDDRDQCPNTPYGLTVDSVGCNNDHDGDGVANAQDKCPNTPKGTPVNAEGCPLEGDADGDGVLDSKDECPDTPETDKVDEKGCSIYEESEVTGTLNVLFDNDSDVVNNPRDDQFQRFADFMARYTNVKAVIEGHTSSIGDAEYNQDLSERRAKAVEKILVDDFGVDASRISSVGYGETRPIAEGDSPSAHAANRRIDATISAMEKRSVKR